MSQVAKRGSGHLIQDTSRIPEAVNDIINMEAWASAVVRGTPYKEPDPDFIMRSLAIKAITAETPDEVFRQHNIRRAQEWITDEPGAGTGPIEILDLYVAESDFETGSPSYVIMSCVSLETGEEYKLTTGARNVQATLIGLIVSGVWPIRVQIKRGEMKDKGGRYLLFMLPPD